ncbi:unnamed protein product [Parascedosporium putredinis]|uniref:Uncharacterized protein n=1 Tax=Parascedosporium putredinis TaxID=1442378 RepID=A0A9P1GUH5_9PEZI|nr:unnamed protein product [Parascedosporium putredinis]CAI7987346.1 unnamed protein product [Parascedosporium putredinis]
MPPISFKPVSSLRSHFESMSKAKEGNPALQAAPLRPISPAPKQLAVREAHPERETVPTPPPLPKNRPTLNAIKLPSSSNNIGDAVRPKSPTRPAVPPPTFSPRPGRPRAHRFPQPRIYHCRNDPASSPRTFKIPSRTHSPVLDPRRLSKTTGSNPPSPPPPRRSGEFKREMKPVPPPVNRAEKPTILSRHSMIAPRPQNGIIHTPQLTQETSPFSSPPSSPESSDDEAPPPIPRRPRPQSEYSQSRSQGWNTFEPPPVHPAVLRRPEREAQQAPRSNISPNTRVNVAPPYQQDRSTLLRRYRLVRLQSIAPGRHLPSASSAYGKYKLKFCRKRLSSAYSILRHPNDIAID